MYVCMYACIHTHTHTHTHTYVCRWLVCICRHACVNVRVHMCMHVRICICVRVCVHVHICTCIIHVYMRARTHTLPHPHPPTRTHTPRRGSSSPVPAPPTRRVAQQRALARGPAEDRAGQPDLDVEAVFGGLVLERHYARVVREHVQPRGGKLCLELLRAGTDTLKALQVARDGRDRGGRGFGAQRGLGGRRALRGAIQHDDVGALLRHCAR